MKSLLKATGLIAISLIVAARVSAEGTPIRGTAHDFTIGYAGGAAATTLCSTCHEMHKPIKMKPLWARQNPTGASWYVNSGGKKTILPPTYVENPLYVVGSSVNYTSKSPIPVAAFLDSRSGLCLSCHDGQTPISAGGGNMASVRGNFTTDLSNNHAIGKERGLYNRDTGLLNPQTVMDYNDKVVITDSKTPANAVTRYFLGCTTCHGIHDTINPKLLRGAYEDATGPVCWNCHTGK